MNWLVKCRVAIQYSDKSVVCLVGVWFLHCHLEVHTTWGLKMVFVVDNGEGPDESLLPPPSDLPNC
jgi:hypothetical protein